MASRANPYGYSDPALGQAFSNLAHALMGSAHDDAYLANAQANRMLAQKRQQEIADAQALSSAMTTTSQNPLFQGRVYEAMGFGPVQVDEGGNFIRPVGPNDPQMSVPVLPNQYQVTPQQHSALARTFLGEGGNMQQTTAGLNNLGTAISHRGAERLLLNPDAPGVSENQLRGASILLKGPAGVDADFAPTVNAQNRVQGHMTERNNYTADQRLAGDKYSADQRLSGTRYTADKNLQGKRYEVDNKPVVVNQNDTAFIPKGAQGRFGDKTELRGQQSPVIVPQGSTALIPDARQDDFAEGKKVEGQPKPGSGSGSGGKATKITGADQKAMDGQITGYEKTLNTTHDASTGIPPAIKVLIRENAATRLRSGTADEVNNVPLATNNALKEFYGTPYIYNPTMGKKVVVPERVILDAQAAIDRGANADQVLNVANSKFGISRDALNEAIAKRKKGQ
jgi:hypothetical protein